MALLTDSPLTVGAYSIGALPEKPEDALQLVKYKETEVTADILYSSAFYGLKMTWDDAQLTSSHTLNQPEPASNPPDQAQLCKLGKQVDSLTSQLDAMSSELAELRSKATDETESCPQAEVDKRTVQQAMKDTTAHPHVLLASDCGAAQADELLSVPEAEAIMAGMETLSRALNNTPSGRIGRYAKLFQPGKRWKVTPPQDPESIEPQPCCLTRKGDQPATITAIRYMTGTVTLQATHGSDP